MIGDTVISFFDVFGVMGMGLALFFIFLIDSMLFPALPDFFLLVIFSTDPHNIAWGVSLLVIAALASFSGNALLYILVKKYSLPTWIKKAMQKYNELLIIKDERILLVNRIAPVLPYTGAFIALNRWDYKKSMSYIVLGAVVKFGILLILSGTFYQLFEEGIAQTATFLLIILTIIISLIATLVERKKLKK